MHIAFLMTNTDETAFAQARPRDGEKFERLLHSVRPDWQVTVFSVKDGVFPPIGARFDGWMIGGSPASVNDDDPWIARLLGLIRDLSATGQPMFGACFGHQAIAKALGGTVADNPQGWVFGVTETVMEGAPLRLYAAHTEQVTALPPGARGLGGNDGCAVGSFAMGDRVLTTQYHPEMTTEFFVDLVDEFAPDLPADVAATARATAHTPADIPVIAERIARFFEGAAR